MIRRIGLSGGGLVLAALVAGCGIENGIVGGACIDGYVRIGDRCAPVNAAAADAPAGDTLSPDGTGPRGSAGTSVTTHADITPPGAISRGAPTPGVVTSPLLPEPDLELAPPPAPPPPPPPLVCGAPLVVCRGECIPVTEDPANCGACGKICPSNICIAGECQGATPGDVVVIGHDFANAWSGSAHAKVLLNAVGIPTTDPIRIASYEMNAPTASVLQARAVIESGIRGRGVAITDADADTLATETLALTYDVVLIHDAAGTDPSALGARWADALERFTKKGGVVVALDGAASRMPELLTSSRLFPIAAHVALPGTTQFVVDAPADVVGAQLLSPYAAMGPSVGFVTAKGPDTTWVVRERKDDGGGLPIVLHRTVR